MANFSLNTLTSFFANFAHDRSASVLGVDIGSSAIKVVQLRRDRGRAILETYGALALGPYANTEIGRATSLPAEAIVRALMDVLREANITAKDAALSIPYAASLVSVIKVPKVEERKLAQMIPIEARKYIPVPITEVMLDWYAIPDSSKTPADERQAASQTSVLLVAIHNDTIAKYQDIVKNSALSASFFEIEVFSTVRSSLDRGIAPVAILDMGASSTKLYITERGIVRESHIINRGGQDITLRRSAFL
jgi:type IV pilus assembly protein PilM